MSGVNSARTIWIAIHRYLLNAWAISVLARNIGSLDTGNFILEACARVTTYVQLEFNPGILVNTSHMSASFEGTVALLKQYLSRLTFMCIDFASNSKERVMFTMDIFVCTTNIEQPILCEMHYAI